MAEESSEKADKVTTYGRSKSKWNKKMTPQGGHEGPSPRIIVAAVLALILLIFILRNGHTTRVNLLFFTWDTTVRWSLFIAVLLGVALDRLVIWGMARHRQHDESSADSGEAS